MSGTIVGFIGTGNMAASLAAALVKTDLKANDRSNSYLYFSNRTPEKAEALAKKLNVGYVLPTNAAVAKNSDLILLGVKPSVVRAVAAEILPVLKARQKHPPVLISMAAGITLETLRECTEGVCPLVRIMPNTPCAAGAGTVLYAYEEELLDAEKIKELIGLFAEAGEWIELPESQIDAAGVLSGCGPAYAYEIIESMGDGGVLCGLPRALSYRLAARALLGAAALMENTGENPSVLKDNVTSPGGSTIKGLRAMERGAVRSAMIEAVAASHKKNKELGR